MPRPTVFRAFVYLTAGEVEFLNHLGRIVQEKTGRKRAPPLRRIIQGVVLDYCRIIQTGSNPELLEAFEKASRRSHARVLRSKE